MNGFFKRKTTTAGNGANPKRARSGQGNEPDNNLNGDPHVIVAWNCNGLTSRLRSGDDKDIKAFILEHRPDVIFLSEVRIASANNCASGKPGPNTKWFRSRMRDSDKKSLEDVAITNKFLFSKELSVYKTYFSLADTKYAGTAMLVNTETMRLPSHVRYNLDGKDVKAAVHDSDGRVILAKFETFSILHTYSPNNGWEHDHFERRRAWDRKMETFMAGKKEKGISVMWVGDLNVAPQDEDLSHPAFFRKQVGGRNAKKDFDAQALAVEDIGQPGCTEGERKRFASILACGDLLDGYRELVGHGQETEFSWRGISTGKHGGRGMRIDHCIIARRIFLRLRSVQITGHGVERTGFLGSDHSPVVIKMDSKSKADGKSAPERRDSNSAHNDEIDSV